MRIKESNLRKIIRSFLVEALGKSYWGIAGAGMVFVCPDDGTVFLQKRGDYVSGGAGQWGFPGGGIHPEDDYEHHWRTPIPADLVLPDNSPKFYEKAIEEVEEECGSVPPHRVVDSYIYEDDGFKYKTFVASVGLLDKENWKSKAEDMHSWEVGEDGWFFADEFQQMNLFFGFTPGLISKVLNAVNK